MALTAACQEVFSKNKSEGTQRTDRLISRPLLSKGRVAVKKKKDSLGKGVAM
jgi:hypothetical protein